MTPESIRALLDGITAGEWVAEVSEAYDDDGAHSDYQHVRVELADLESDTYLTEADAAFIGAAPGIARYALELAERLAEYEQFAAVIRSGCKNYCQPVYAVYGRHAPECMATELPALAPQPAPTGGAPGAVESAP